MYIHIQYIHIYVYKPHPAVRHAGALLLQLPAP